jgi:Protein of unknown function (DUF3606)
VQSWQTPKRRCARTRRALLGPPFTKRNHTYYEKKYWKKKFGVSGQALAGAVRTVGSSAKKVEQYLKDKR